MPTGGGSPSHLTHEATEAFAVDGGTVYWAAWTAARRDAIYATTTGGTHVVVRLNASTTVDELFVSHAALFWIADFSAVQTAPLSSGVITTLARAIPSTGHIRSLTTDGTYLYYTMGADIMRLQLSGGSPLMFLHYALMEVVRANVSDLYTASFGGDVSRISLASTPPSAARLSLVAPRNFMVTNDKIYWVNRRTAWAWATSGTQPSQIMSGSDNAGAIAVDATSLYYVTDAGEVVRITPR